jgi:hypothetical protein
VGTTLDDIITNKINNDKIDIDGTLAANSDTLVASQKATKTYVDGKVTTINGTITSGLALKENISDKVTTQGTFISNGTSVVKYPAVKAVKDYVDGVATGLLRDNGNYNPTVTSNFPTSANTLSGGAIQVGDLWYISANGTVNGNSVLVGYSVRALVNAAGATNNADWAIANVGLGFVPENSANKSNDGTFNAGVPSAVQFPTQAAVATYLAANSPELPLEYVGVFSQTGTNAPTVDVKNNTLGGTVVWTRNSAGSYTGTLVGAFAGNSVVITMNQTLPGPDRTLFTSISSNDTVSILCRKISDSKFADFGQVKLGNASIDTTSVSGTLSQTHLYASEILAQLTIVV